MTELDAAIVRHVPIRDHYIYNPDREVCAEDYQDWRCDFAVAIAALNEAQAKAVQHWLRLMAVTEERDAALARERALVDGLHPFDDVQGTCLWCDGGWEQVRGPRGGRGQYVNTGKHRDGCAYAASIAVHCGECAAWDFEAGANVPDHVHEVTT